MKKHEQERAGSGARSGEQQDEPGLIARLGRLRMHAGQPTIETIARHAGRSMGAVSNTFSGNAVPSDDTAERIVTALGGSFDEEWRTLLTEARTERALKARTKDEEAATSTVPADPVKVTGGHGKRNLIIAGLVTLGVLAAAAVMFFPDLSGTGTEPSTRGDVEPVVVTGAGPLGLIVRSSGLRDGVQIGSAADGQTLWAECRSVTDFDPRPDTGKGSAWYRVRWPNPGPAKDYFSSTPQDGYSGWVYGGFTAPKTPGGGPVPQC